jgi:hypothetical protein
MPSWYGISCRMGRLALWLPVQETPGQYREFSLLALLPNKDLREAPPFIRLGTQFVLEHRIKVLVDGASPEIPGRFIIP